MSKEQSSIEMAEFMTASATWGEVNMLEDYLKNGADPNAVNLKGDSTLHVACFYGEIECANTLLSSRGLFGPVCYIIFVCIETLSFHCVLFTVIIFTLHVFDLPDPASTSGIVSCANR